MPHDIDTTPIIIRVADSNAVPVNDIPAAEWDEYKSRVIAQENKALTDLSDVNVGSAADGDTIVRSGSQWVPGQPAGIIERVSTNWNANASDDVSLISFGPGLDVHPSWTTERAHIVLIYGGTGSSNAVAREDHTHSIRPDTQLTFSASGSFSSGTRTLVSGTVTGLDPARTYVLKGVLDVQLRGDGSGAGYTRPRITINGNSVDMPERPRNVAGVQPCYTMRHPGVTVSGVSSVAVNATIAYSEGDPTWVGGGALTISIESNR